MRTKMKMRLLSLLLCFVMLLGMIPTATYAGIRDELEVGFTTQPRSGTALITEGYAYTWELSIVPGMQALQVLNPLNAEEWITLGTLKGNSDVLQFPGVEYVRNGKSVYRVAAAAMDNKGNISEYYSDIFIVTWTEGYTVSFDANGGTGTMSDVEVEMGEYTLPACTFTAPSGKEFKAWSVDGVEKNAGDIITVTADTTVTAVWKYLPVIYNVSFNANGGTGTMSDVEVEMGEYTLPTCTFTAPEGKEFWCWNVSGEKKQPGDVINVTTGLIVYAQWRLPSEYTKLGEVSEVTATATINPMFGETASAPDFVVTAPTGKGVDIVNVGWYKKNESGDWVRYSADSEFEAGTYCLSVQLRTDKNRDKEYYALTTDVTLTVNGTPWTAEENTYYDYYYYGGFGWIWFQSGEYTVAEKEGLIKNPDTGVFEYYVDGELATDYSGTVENAGYTWYVINGILDSSYTGIRYDGTDFWYVNNGKVNTSFVGLYNFADAWWYVKDGKIQKDYKGMVDYSGYTWYVANGKVDITFTGLGLHEGVWYCVQAGKVNMSYSGLVLNGGSWWYVTEGILDTSVTGIVETGGSQWLVGTGKLQSTYTGTYTQGGVTYNIVNGKVVS